MYYIKSYKAFWLALLASCSPADYCTVYCCFINPWVCVSSCFGRHHMGEIKLRPYGGRAEHFFLVRQDFGVNVKGEGETGPGG